MPKSVLPVQPRVWTVRADASISECVRILRENSVGALVILSDDKNEEIVGIFTERDLVRNLELIRFGTFWETPVRTVMSTSVKTITVAELHKAPALMERYQIRHLPVIVNEGKKKRLVGVLSMRDVFRSVMEHFDFDLSHVYRAPEPVPRQARKILAVFSADAALLSLADKGAKLTRHILVKAIPFHTELENLEEILDRFDAIILDLDALSAAGRVRIFAMARALGKKQSLFLVFNPSRLTAENLSALQALSKRGQVHLLSKPIALGLLYEKFLKGI